MVSNTTQHPPPPAHTVWLYFYFGNGGGGREVNQREGQRGNSSQSWVENTNMCQSINSIFFNTSTDVI
jgi:hypothetical protein